MAKLTLLEHQCLTTQEKKRINPKTYTLLEKYASKLSPKDALYTKKCISSLKTKIDKETDLKENIFKLYDLKENTLRLLKESEEKRKSIPDKTNIKKIVISMMDDDRRDLETIFVEFDIEFKPYGSSRAAVGREIERIVVKNDQLGSKIIRRLLPKFAEDFTGTAIYQGYLRATPVNPGKSVKARNELAIDTEYIDNPKTFEQYVVIISEMLDGLDKEILNWLDIENFDEANVDVKDQPVVNGGEGEEGEEEVINDNNYYKDEEEFATPSDEDLEKQILGKIKRKPFTEGVVGNIDPQVVKATVAAVKELVHKLERLKLAFQGELKSLESGYSNYLSSVEETEHLKNMCGNIKAGIATAIKNS